MQCVEESRHKDWSQSPKHTRKSKFLGEIQIDPILGHLNVPKAMHKMKVFTSFQLPDKTANVSMTRIMPKLAGPTCCAF